jgi:hypothetical protein
VYDIYGLMLSSGIMKALTELIEMQVSGRFAFTAAFGSHFCELHVKFN